MNILTKPFTTDELVTPVTYAPTSILAMIVAHRLKLYYSFTAEDAKALVTDCCLNTLPLSVPLAPLMESNPELFI